MVSVVIPVYNRENTIERAVRSVLQQTYNDLEVIVVDDCSTDNTRLIVDGINDARVSLVCQQQRKGANAARNVGIMQGKGEYIAFQDSDDEWVPDKLERQIKLMDEEGTLGCYSAFYYVDRGYIYPEDYKDNTKYRDNLRNILKVQNVVDTPTLVLKREITDLLDNSFFDEDIPRLQDYDFALRLSQVCNLSYVDAPLVNVYTSKNSISSDISALYDAAGKIINKYRGWLDIPQFINTIMGAETFEDSSEDLLSRLNGIRKISGCQDCDCKDIAIKCMNDVITFQRKLLWRYSRGGISNLEDKKFAIYGAGMMGKLAYQELKQKGLTPICFLVTESGERDFIDDIPICSIDEYADKETMIIVAVTEKYQIEMVDNLYERKFKYFYVYKDGILE